MKVRTKILAVSAAVILVGFGVWQMTSSDNLLNGVNYPGFINSEELEIPEEVAAQWNIQLNTSIAAYSANDKDFDALMNISFWKQQFGDYAESRRAIETVLENNSINYTAWTMLGDVAFKMEDWETAESAFMKSLELHTDPNLFYKIENVWRTAYPERYPDIETLYKDAITMDTQSPFYLTRLANWYAEQERWQEAADHLEVVSVMFPDDEKVRQEYNLYKSRAN